MDATPTPFRAAMEAGDIDAVVAALSDDVVLRSPIFERTFNGVDEARDLFASLLETLGELRYKAEIPGDPHVLVVETSVDGVPLEIVDLLGFDAEGKVREITVFMRPFPGVAKFLSVSGPPLAKRRSGRATGWAMRAAGLPLSLFMNATAANGPRMLKLRSAKRR